MRLKLKEQFYVRDLWHEKNQTMQASLKLTLNEQGLYVFKDLHLALLEMLWSYSRQYMIRKKIYWIKGLSPYFPSCLELFMGMGYEVHELDYRQAFTDRQWIEKLDHTVLAVLLAKDVPFVGYVFDWSEILKQIAEKRVFQIEIAHNYQYIHGISPANNPFHIQLYDFIGQGAVCVFGKRAQFEPVITTGMNWEGFSLDASYEVGQRPEDRQQVENFEKQLPALSWRIDPSQKRLYDRAVFSWRDMDATALRALLLEKVPDLKPGEIQTTSLSTWGGLKTMNWLLPIGLDLEILRGLTVIDQQRLSDQLLHELMVCRSEILSLQSGNARQ